LDNIELKTDNKKKKNENNLQDIIKGNGNGHFKEEKDCKSSSLVAP